MFTFVIAAIAGLATPFVEPHMKTLMENLMLEDLKLEPGEFRALSYAVMLVLASLLAALGGGGSAVALAFGGIIGLFGKRIFDAVRARDGSK